MTAFRLLARCLFPLLMLCEIARGGEAQPCEARYEAGPPPTIRQLDVPQP